LEQARPDSEGTAISGSAAEPSLSPHSALSLAFETSGDVMSLVRVEPGPTFRIVALNRACRQIARGLGAENDAEWVGRTLDDVLPHLAIPADARELLLRRHHDATETRRPVRFDDVAQTEGGERIFQSTLTPIFDSDGGCRYVLFSSRDVTEHARAQDLLQQSEAKFARAFQSSPAAMSISRLRDGRFLDVNDACCKLWGYTREEFLGANAVQLKLWHRPADRDEFFKLFNATGSVRELEITIDTRRNAPLTVLFSAERVEVQGEACMIASIYDVTAKREAEQIQRHVEAQLRQSQKLEALGTLTGGIAHDFNNILSVIVGVTDLVEIDVESPDKVRAHLKELRSANDRARNLVRQILSFSRRHASERQVFDVREVVDDALNLLGRGLTSSLRIERTMPTEPVVVRADPHQIHQVLMNLGTNAAHAMRSKPGSMKIVLDKVVTGEVMLTTVPRLEPGSYARITVEDTGHGMDPETVHRIFEPFFTTKKPGEGTGLGLAVVHGIVSEHEGALGVDSRLGEGTRMVVYLPLHEGRPSKPVPAKPRPVPQGHHERIMFVDDEAPVALACAGMLTHIGYDVTVFEKASNALARFTEAPGDFDLVITDLTMPDMTGTELAQGILARRPNMPILLTTGYSAGLTRAGALSQGIAGVLQKPFAIESLAVAVRSALDGTDVSKDDG
jgi:two-component system, cell cycle sensor histidine kinase and response regulator CckA